MLESQKHEIKSLTHAPRDIENGGKEKCTMCRFVLIFAFTGLILTVLFVFFFKAEPTPTLKPLPPELSPPINPETRARENFELGKLFHPELSTSTTPALNTTPGSNQLPVKQ